MEQNKKITLNYRHKGINISKRTVEHHIYLTLLEMKKIIFFAFFLLFP